MHGLFVVSNNFHEGGRNFVPGISGLYLRNYFQDLVVENKLKIFSVEFDKKEIIVEKKDKRVISIRKGVTLEPVKDKLKRRQGYIIENPKTKERYILEINTRKVFISFDEYQNSRYYECLLEKLSSDFEMKRIRKQRRAYKTRELDIPKEAITARLRISYEEDEKTYIYKEGWIDYWSLRLVVEGEQDRLIQQVRSDIQESEKEHV